MTDSTKLPGDALKTWPERIYLQHGTDENPPPWLGSENGEITWASHDVEGNDVPYIRADLATVQSKSEAPLDSPQHSSVMGNMEGAKCWCGASMECRLTDVAGRAAPLMTFVCSAVPQHGFGPLVGQAQSEAPKPTVQVYREDGVALIAAERKRQVEAEGRTSAHDDEHDSGELANAAVTYAKQAYIGATAPLPANDRWPWDEEWWKPSSPIRMLVKAGALIAAEIDRRLRKGERP